MSFWCGTSSITSRALRKCSTAALGGNALNIGAYSHEADFNPPFHSARVYAWSRAFGFSACLNVAALVVAKTKAGERDCVQSQSASCGPDYGPSIFLFVYVGWLVWVLIWSIQARWFPDPTNESSAYEFLRHPNDQQRLQISMTMRTELILRALDLMTDFVFFWDGTRAVDASSGLPPLCLTTPLCSHPHLMLDHFLSRAPSREKTGSRVLF